MVIGYIIVFVSIVIGCLVNSIVYEYGEINFIYMLFLF